LGSYITILFNVDKFLCSWVFVRNSERMCFCSSRNECPMDFRNLRRCWMLKKFLLCWLWVLVMSLYWILYHNYYGFIHISCQSYSLERPAVSVENEVPWSSSLACSIFEIVRTNFVLYKLSITLVKVWHQLFFVIWQDFPYIWCC